MSWITHSADPDGRNFTARVYLLGANGEDALMARRFESEREAVEFAEEWALRVRGFDRCAEVTVEGPHGEEVLVRDVGLEPIGEGAR